MCNTKAVLPDHDPSESEFQAPRRNPIQDNAFLVQLVLTLGFLVFDFGVQAPISSSFRAIVSQPEAQGGSRSASSQAHLPPHTGTRTT
eukprot:3478371-Rhodomonas_salina.1